MPHLLMVVIIVIMGTARAIGIMVPIVVIIIAVGMIGGCKKNAVTNSFSVPPPDDPLQASCLSMTAATAATTTTTSTLAAMDALVLPLQLSMLQLCRSPSFKNKSIFVFLILHYFGGNVRK
jgi:hypothetical protein